MKSCLRVFTEVHTLNTLLDTKIKLNLFHQDVEEINYEEAPANLKVHFYVVFDSPIRALAVRCSHMSSPPCISGLICKFYLWAIQ